MIFGHFIAFGPFPIEIPIEVVKKVPTCEGKVVEQKQKQFWNQCTKEQNLGAAKFNILNLLKEESLYWDGWDGYLS